MKNYITLLLLLIGSIGIANAQYSDRRGGSSLSKYTSVYTNLNLYGTEFPADATGKFIFNFGQDWTRPLNENLGLVWGFGWAFSFFHYNSESEVDLFNWVTNIYGISGYQLEMSDRITMQALIKAGPSLPIVIIDDVGQDPVIDLSGAFSANLFIFLDDMQTKGLRFGTDIGFSGGFNTLIGFVNTF